jgi:hypothetical protein
MANRSYLYSVNKIPSEGPKTPDIRIKGLSEYNWDTPFAFKILVSAGTKVTRSLIYDTETGVVGKYEEGVKNLEKFLKLLRKRGVHKQDIFDRESKQTLEFLKDKQNKQEYIFLEPSEIFAMDAVIRKRAEDLARQIKEMRGYLKENNFDAINRYARDNLRTYWENLLGIDYWVDILAFDFSHINDDENKSHKKQSTRCS